MKRIFIMMVVIVMTLSVSMFAEEVKVEGSTIKLENKIDQLETELEKLRIEISENNPLTTGKPKDWGKGFFFQFLGAGINDSSLDFGYSVILKNWKPWFPAEYLKDKKGYRISYVLGLHTYEDIVFDMDKNKKDYYESDWLSTSFSVKFGTPILMNFISFNSGLTLQYMYSLEEKDKNILQDQIGIGGSSEMEIWVSPKWAFTMGYKTNMPFEIDDTDSDDKHPISNISFTPTFGFKKFF